MNEKCNHKKVDTKPMYDIKVGTCVHCGKVVEYITIPIETLEKDELLDKLKSIDIMVNIVH